MGVVGGESEAVFGTGAAKDDALQAGATKESIFSDVGDLWQVDTCQAGANQESNDSDVGDLWQVDACQAGSFIVSIIYYFGGLWQVDALQSTIAVGEEIPIRRHFLHRLHIEVLYVIMAAAQQS